MTDTLQPCTTARIPAWRLLFGGLLPLALVFYVFLPPLSTLKEAM